MSIHIDSTEVLHHLNSYGIHSIDDNSLKSFIKDLKKLIKYEHYKNVYGTKFEIIDHSYEQNSGNSVIKDDSSSTVHDSRRKTSCCGRKHKENISPIYSEKIPNNNRTNYEAVKSLCPCKIIYSHSAIQSSEFKNEMKTQKSLCKCKKRILPQDEDEKSRIDKLQEGVPNIKRPTSILSCTRSQATSIRNKKGRCDPVELYHYYNSFWKNHKLPGENDHAQLRLAIRKRLMNVK